MKKQKRVPKEKRLKTAKLTKESERGIEIALERNMEEYE
jgi:hypothetical protein